jgi:hypothetical protein
VYSRKRFADSGGIYVVTVAFGTERWFKLGQATDFRSRISSLQSGCPVAFGRVLVMPLPVGLNSDLVEASLHIELEDIRHAGEWFVGDVTDELLARVNEAVGRFGLSPGWIDMPHARSERQQATARSRSAHQRALHSEVECALREREREREEKMARQRSPTAVEIRSIYRRRTISGT